MKLRRGSTSTERAHPQTVKQRVTLTLTMEVTLSSVGIDKLEREGQRVIASRQRRLLARLLADPASLRKVIHAVAITDAAEYLETPGEHDSFRVLEALAVKDGPDANVWRKISAEGVFPENIDELDDGFSAECVELKVVDEQAAPTTSGMSEPIAPTV
jgi:hypothetical protein